MNMEELIKQLNWTYIPFFALFALPGFISLRIWNLVVPSEQRPLRDELAEAIAFGIVNSALLAPLVAVSTSYPPWITYAAFVFALVVMPAIWPFLLRWLLARLHGRNVILNPTRNGWDEAFLRRQRYFVIVHLKDGRRIGGYYGYASYAGVYPTSGHLYLEALWKLDEDGKFIAPIPGSRGIVLRPDDYHFVELLSPSMERNNGEKHSAS